MLDSLEDDRLLDHVDELRTRGIAHPLDLDDQDSQARMLIASTVDFPLVNMPPC